MRMLSLALVGILAVAYADSNHTRSARSPFDGPQHTEKFLFAVAKKRIADQKRGAATFVNTDMFPGVVDGISDSTIVIVVMVHSRHEYFKNFLDSLRDVKDIGKHILIISQDYISNELENLISTIDFVVYAQIFCPASTQLNEGKFPGDIECTGINPSNGKKICVRNGAFPAPKHHWWWKGNYVFDGIPQLKAFNGYVLMLEEDYIVLPDLLHVIPVSAKAGYELCPTCSLMIIGAHSSSIDYSVTSSVNARNHKENIGMVMNRRFWTKLKACKKDFCEYDDYNWDWTLIVSGHKATWGCSV